MSWERIAATTIPLHMRQLEDDTLRKRATLSMMKEKGNIVYNLGGDQFDWRVRWRDHNLYVNDGEAAISFERTNLYKKAVLDWYGYQANDFYTEREKHQNKGNEAIIKTVSMKAEELMKSVLNKFQKEFYVDSSATGNSQRLAGLESMFAGTQTITVTTGAAQAAAAADPAGYPNDTYAGISTVLGNYAGTWNTQTDINSTWPFGNGDAEYDFWSPVLVNYTSTAFGGTTATWKDQATKATRFGVDAVNARCGSGEGVDLVLLSPGLYRLWKDQFDQYQRVQITSAKDSGWGFGDYMDFDGAKVMSDFDVPPGVGYILSMSNVSYHSCYGSSIFQAKGPIYDEVSQSYRFVVNTLGQLKFASPKHFGKLVALA